MLTICDKTIDNLVIILKISEKVFYSIDPAGIIIYLGAQTMVFQSFVLDAIVSQVQGIYETLQMLQNVSKILGECPKCTLLSRVMYDNFQ